MLLLLVSSTAFEIRETAAWLNNQSHGLNALKAKLLISGIGQLQTTFALQNQISISRPDLVIQAGIGGSVSKEDIGKTFVIGSEILADLGLMEKSGFSSIFKMGLEESGRFPFQEGKLINPYRDLLEWTGLKVLEGQTVNEIKSSDINGFQRNQRTVVESMEGAALHYVCLMEKIPFLQIRSVSNILGDRDKSRWKIKEAVEDLHKTLVFLINKLEIADETLFRI